MDRTNNILWSEELQSNSLSEAFADQLKKDFLLRIHRYSPEQTGTVAHRFLHDEENGSALLRVVVKPEIDNRNPKMTVEIILVGSVEARLSWYFMRLKMRRLIKNNSTKNRTFEYDLEKVLILIFADLLDSIVMAALAATTLLRFLLKPDTYLNRIIRNIIEIFKIRD